MIVVVETWFLKPEHAARAEQVMQEMDDLIGPQAHEHRGWSGHASFWQSSDRPEEVMLSYPWRSRSDHEDLLQHEEPLLADFMAEHCSDGRRIQYFTPLAVDVEDHDHDH